MTGQPLFDYSPIYLRSLANVCVLQYRYMSDLLHKPSSLVEIPSVKNHLLWLLLPYFPAVHTKARFNNCLWATLHRSDIICSRRCLYSAAVEQHACR